MENQETMVNEVMDVTEDIATVGSGRGLKLFGGALAVAGLAYGGYKLIKKFRKPKKEADVVVDTVDPDSVCVD